VKQGQLEQSQMQQQQQQQQQQQHWVQGANPTESAGKQ